MTTAKPKKAKRGRPENPKYQETIRIDASRRQVHHEAPAEARKQMALSEREVLIDSGMGDEFAYRKSDNPGSSLNP